MSCVWALNTVKIQCVPFCFLKRRNISNCDLSGKTFQTLSRFYMDSRSPAVHQPFKQTGMPFERVELTVLKNSSSVQTVRAMRSTKLISRSNGSSYPFEKIHQPFQRLELSVRENSSAVWTARAIRSRKFISCSNGSSYPFKKETVSYFDSCSKKTRRDDFKTINSPFFVKWRMPSCLHYTNSRHASVLCLPPLKWYSLHFLRKNVWFTSSYWIENLTVLTCSWRLKKPRTSALRERLISR